KCPPQAHGWHLMHSGGPRRAKRAISVAPHRETIRPAASSFTRKANPVRTTGPSMTRVFILAALGAVLAAPAADAACCYFSARNADILQPAQKVFITWEPATKTETFTVKPKFEGNALDFG